MWAGRFSEIEKTRDWEDVEKTVVLNFLFATAHSSFPFSPAVWKRLAPSGCSKTSPMCVGTSLSHGIPFDKCETSMLFSNSLELRIQRQKVDILEFCVKVHKSIFPAMPYFHSPGKVHCTGPWAARSKLERSVLGLWIFRHACQLQKKCFHAGFSKWPHMVTSFYEKM